MRTTWLATKTTLTHATRNRYQWMVNHNIASRIGDVRLDALHPADLDACYADLVLNGGKLNQGLAAKTVLEIHRTVSNALDLAVDRRLIDATPPTKHDRHAQTADRPSRRYGQLNNRNDLPLRTLP